VPRRRRPDVLIPVMRSAVVDPQAHPFPRVLVTGASRYLAPRCARLEAGSRIDRVIGVDAPDNETAKLLITESVQAVVHLAIVSAAGDTAGGRSAMKEQNVIALCSCSPPASRPPS